MQWGRFVAFRAAQSIVDVTAASLVLELDRRTMRGGPAIAPSGQRNDHGFEHEPSFGRPIVVHVPCYDRSVRRSEHAKDFVRLPIALHINTARVKYAIGRSLR